jgi:hypothetical protein
LLDDVPAADVENFPETLPGAEDMVELVYSMFERGLDFDLMFIEISDLIEGIRMSSLRLELDKDLNVGVLTLSFWWLWTVCDRGREVLSWSTC